MNLNKKELGKKGEEGALIFLTDKGYKLIEKNFRCKIGEIDLIMEKEEELVFVEVRSKTNFSWGQPYETISYSKQNKLYKLAEYYLSLKDCENIICRFDVISVLITSQGEIMELEHIENAFGV